MKLNRNEPCWCGSGKKYKQCHINMDHKLEELKKQGYEVPPRKIIKNSYQIEKIKESAKLNTAILDYISTFIKAGITTGEIDRLVHDFTVEHGGIPAPLNYGGFPKSLCTSINEEVCHGIPDDNRYLKDGDIINVDISTILDGYFSDASRMFMIGEVSEEAERLVRVTKECVQKGLEEVKPGALLGDVGAAVHAHAKANGYTVVEEIGGHGIGLAFHEEPYVSHVAEKGTGMVLVPGMMFTIEPMVNQGTDKIIEDAHNGWTVYTADKKLSAQWENMVLVTEDGYEVLTS